ncbi:ras-related protein Rab-6A isoform X5 [Bubalus kerabau]|uniref:ras-related protein Rab-6A isoform X5 n=1 Tax=Bubalus carabanensis TaxID=3119969 RepID=UPI00244E870D|nr:ras-related protein Rab-6A isoform X5 [Bubalus carabanensis]
MHAGAGGAAGSRPGSPRAAPQARALSRLGCGGGSCGAEALRLRASLGARRLRGEATATAACLCRGALLSSLAPPPGPAGAERARRRPFLYTLRQPVGAASVREVSGLRRRQLLRLHHVRGRRLRESAEEIQAGVPGGAERFGSPSFGNQRRKRKGIQFGKEVKLSLFADEISHRRS